MKTILSNTGFKVRAITPNRMGNCFSFKMYLSTRDHNEATSREYVIALADSQGPRQNAGEII